MINKATLIGRIGKKTHNPTKYGSHMCKLSIVTNRKYIDSKGYANEISTWHSIHAYNILADSVEKYCNVGELVYIEGEIINKRIEENEKIRYVSYIVANEVKAIPNTKKDNSIKPEEIHGQDIPLHMDAEDIPF